MAGRPPKPTHLHIVDGTLNATRHKDRKDEPQPTGRPEKPKGLKGLASQLWDKYSEIGYWLTAADSEALAIWCQLSALCQRSFKKLTPSMLAQHRAYGSILGFDPSSRTRIRPSKGSDKPEDPAE